MNSILVDGVAYGPNMVRALKERATELEKLVRCLVENNPNDDAADGVTVLDVWRKDAERILST